MRHVKLPISLALAMAPLQARADGLGGLAGLRQLGLLAAGAFCLLWIVAWVVVRAARKRRGGKAYWLRDGEIPLPLRLLALAQYLLAFGYAFLALTDLLMPGDFRRESAIRAIFAAAIALLCIASAGGYLARSHARGLLSGGWLGCVCVANTGFSFLLRGSADDFDFVSLLLAVALLIVLWRYRTWFQAPVAGS